MAATQYAISELHELPSGAFECVIFKDGKKFAHSRNAGNGGCNVTISLCELNNFDIADELRAAAIDVGIADGPEVDDLFVLVLMEVYSLGCTLSEAVERLRVEWARYGMIL